MEYLLVVALSYYVLVLSAALMDSLWNRVNPPPMEPDPRYLKPFWAKERKESKKGFTAPPL